MKKGPFKMKGFTYPGKSPLKQKEENDSNVPGDTSEIFSKQYEGQAKAEEAKSRQSSKKTKAIMGLADQAKGGVISDETKAKMEQLAKMGTGMPSGGGGGNAEANAEKKARMSLGKS